ncbi:hypothetical protein [Xylanibacter caecicola]|uniref:hypothetical protein n=1 Tax=Xylanibacter caecicola TaxID=2736294 RepID=UPI002585F288|nr:hypothetical protein [Xylanibacter caecicola]
MQIIETSAEEYGALFTSYPHIYNSVSFSELNKRKTGRLHYLTFRNPKVRFGLVLGEDNGGTLASPFSAPFGGLTYNKAQSIEFIDDAIKALKEYGRERNMRIRITLPPFFYDDRHLPCVANALYREARLCKMDINYHFLISDFADYPTVIERNAKKNLRHAMEQDTTFIIADSSNEDDIKRAYGIIKKNREEHGYPLRMTYEDVIGTTHVIPADFFILQHGYDDMAAAQVFHVTDKIYQVIYWGDLRGFSSLRPMNLLAYRIFEHYHKQGIEILDIGPSTEDSIPNYGLCCFKESIGCRSSLKLSFEI